MCEYCWKHYIHTSTTNVLTYIKTKKILTDKIYNRRSRVQVLLPLLKSLGNKPFLGLFYLSKMHCIFLFDFSLFKGFSFDINLYNDPFCSINELYLDCTLNTLIIKNTDEIDHRYCIKKLHNYLEISVFNV